MMQVSSKASFWKNMTCSTIGCQLEISEVARIGRSEFLGFSTRQICSSLQIGSLYGRRGLASIVLIVLQGCREGDESGVER